MSRKKQITNGVFIVLPAYCEGKVIKAVIKDIKKEGYRNIVVVNDGSVDNTHSEASSEGIISISHLINRGKGAATQTGIDAAKLLGAEIIVTIDADGQHSPKDIKRIIKPILQEEADVVIGSRLLDKKNMPLSRKLMNKIANIVTNIFYGITVSDSQSGFRAYSKRAFSSVYTYQDGYEFESEMLGQIRKENLTIKEVPIEAIYSEYCLKKYKHLGRITGQSFINGTRMIKELIISKLIN